MAKKVVMLQHWHAQRAPRYSHGSVSEEVTNSKLRTFHRQQQERGWKGPFSDGFKDSIQQYNEFMKNNNAFLTFYSCN